MQLKIFQGKYNSKSWRILANKSCLISTKPKELRSLIQSSLKNIGVTNSVLQNPHWKDLGGRHFCASLFFCCWMCLHALSVVGGVTNGDGTILASRRLWSGSFL